MRLYLKKIFNQFHQAILSNIIKLIHNQHESEDVLQEVFIALWNKRQQLTTEHSVGGWLFTTSFYMSLRHLKNKIKHGVTPFTDNLNEAFISNDEAQASEKDYNEKLLIVNTAIESLPRQKRIAFRLYRIEGKTYEEIAAVLNISAESARDYVKSASKLLKRNIKTKNLQQLLVVFFY